MSDVVILLARCRELGAEFTPTTDSKLRVRARAPLPEELREELRQHKAEVLALLNDQQSFLSSHQSRQTSAKTRGEESSTAGGDTLPEDYSAVALWLAEQHPGLWGNLGGLEEEIIRLERNEGATRLYQATLAALLTLYHEAKVLQARTWRRLLIKSAVLGEALVWVVKDEEAARAVMGDDRAVFYTEEFAVLKTKTPEQIRDVHTAKLAFPGCRVVQ